MLYGNPVKFKKLVRSNIRSKKRFNWIKENKNQCINFFVLKKNLIDLNEYLFGPKIFLFYLNKCYLNLNIFGVLSWLL